jgi:CRP/FNR family transcriptional regulator, nitrogen oxide reductase regulator
MSAFRTRRRNLGSADVGPGAEPSPVWLEGSRPGDYTEALYDSASDLLPFAARFVGDGIARGERCLYVFDDSMPGAVAAALAGQGVDVAEATRHLALELVSAQRFGAVGSFDAGPLIEHLRGWAGEPDLHNFTGVRIAAEMTWACRTADADKAVMAFNVLFDAGIDGRALTGAGMYRCGRFGVPALRRSIRGHRRVLAPDHIYVGLSPMLHGLTEEARGALLDAARERLVSKGRSFYNQGDEAAEILLLTRGRVAFSRVDRDGQRVTSLDIGIPSDVFGYHGALADGRRAASALALDDSRVLVWDAALFRRTITARPEIAASAIEFFISQRTAQWHDLRILATERVEQRLARVLWRLVNAAGRRTPQGAVIEVALSGQHLADMAATTPYSISRLFATWRRQHIVDARRDHIQIVDAGRLASIAWSDAETESFVS